MFAEIGALRRKAKTEARDANKDAKSVTLPPPVNAVARAVVRRSEFVLSVRHVDASAFAINAGNHLDGDDARLNTMLRLLRMPVERKTVTPVTTRLRDALQQRLERAREKASALSLLADQLQSTRLSQVPRVRNVCPQRET